jgi:hypothetical protein
MLNLQKLRFKKNEFGLSAWGFYGPIDQRSWLFALTGIARSIRSILLFVVIVVLWATQSFEAHANDRPFTTIINAVSEDDDENNFTFETWLVSSSKNRSIYTNLEYNVNPWLSLQLGLGWSKGLRASGFEKSVDVEIKKLFFDPARDGFGLGLSAEVEWEREPGSGSFKAEAIGLTIPFSFAFAEKSGWVHLNVGARYVADDKTRASWGLAVERQLAKGLSGFVEIAGRLKDDRHLTVGSRYWLKRDRFAVDFSASRIRSNDKPSQTAVSLGFSIQDVSF